jgi:hypothetical protein
MPRKTTTAYIGFEELYDYLSALYSHFTIYKYLSGQTIIYPKLAQSLSESFGIPPEAFTGGFEEFREMVGRTFQNRYHKEICEMKKGEALSRRHVNCVLLGLENKQVEAPRACFSDILSAIIHTANEPEKLPKGKLNHIFIYKKKTYHLVVKYGEGDSAEHYLLPIPMHVDKNMFHVPDAILDLRLIIEDGKWKLAECERLKIDSAFGKVIHDAVNYVRNLGPGLIGVEARSDVNAILKGEILPEKS